MTNGIKRTHKESAASSNRGEPAAEGPNVQENIQQVPNKESLDSIVNVTDGYDKFIIERTFLGIFLHCKEEIVSQNKKNPRLERTRKVDPYQKTVITGEHYPLMPDKDRDDVVKEINYHLDRRRIYMKFLEGNGICKQTLQHLNELDKEGPGENIANTKNGILYLSRKDGVVLVSEMDSDAIEELKSVYTTDDIEKMKSVYTTDAIEKMKSVYNHNQSTTFFKDLKKLLELSHKPNVQKYCRFRLKHLKRLFKNYHMSNQQMEHRRHKEYHRGFANVDKVDTHIHAGRCITAGLLTRFIKDKLDDKVGNDEKNPNGIVHKYEEGKETWMRTEMERVLEGEDGKLLTLEEVFQREELAEENVEIHQMDVKAAGDDMFAFFHDFNLKGTPFGKKTIREIFLKHDNFMQGKYYAELLHRVFAELKRTGTYSAELRLSIYGKKADEWKKLAKWAVENNLLDNENVRFMIQVPRVFSEYRKKGLLPNFDKLLENIFMPLFQATNDPKNPEYANIVELMKHISGFDSVDDETKEEAEIFSTIEPEKYEKEENPPYNYYLHYMYANISALNAFRELKKVTLDDGTTENGNTFTLRPHCGEGRSSSHFFGAFLTSESINHGLHLNELPVMEYLYYLSQIGMAMSPISNHYLCRNIKNNPIMDYFKIGQNISISTDDPMTFHSHDNSLKEEYSFFSTFHKLSDVDKCELARNSVLQSGFAERKEKLLGKEVEDKDVTSMRIQFRSDALDQELKALVLNTQEITVTPETGRVCEDQTFIIKTSGDKRMVFKVKCIYEGYEFEPKFGFVENGEGTKLKVTAEKKNKLAEIGEEEFVIRYAPVLSTGTYGILVTNLATVTEKICSATVTEEIAQLAFGEAQAVAQELVIRLEFAPLD